MSRQLQRERMRRKRASIARERRGKALQRSVAAIERLAGTGKLRKNGKTMLVAELAEWILQEARG